MATNHTIAMWFRNMKSSTYERTLFRSSNQNHELNIVAGNNIVGNRRNSGEKVSIFGMNMLVCIMLL